MSKVSIENGPGVEDKESPVDRRRSPRANLIVKVDYATVDELFSEFTRDVNEGGVFIETESPRELGSIVELRFSLPGCDEVIETPGTVVRVVEGSAGEAAGMAIEFDDLGDAARTQINDLIRSLKAEAPH